MDSEQKTVRIVGLLFLLSAITGILGIFLKGLPLSFTESAKPLKTIFENSSKINISVLCDVTTSILLVGITILLFPILEKLNRYIALWYFGFSVIGFAIIVAGNVSILSLLSLSQVYVKSVNHDTVFFQTLAILKQDNYFKAHFMNLIVSGFGPFPFYYILFKTKLIPRFLSAWGLVAVTLVIIATWFQVFGEEVNLLLYLPNGLFVLTFSIWLIVKGFNFSALNPNLGIT